MSLKKCGWKGDFVTIALQNTKLTELLLSMSNYCMHWLSIHKMELLASLAVDYNSKAWCHASVEFVDADMLVNFMVNVTSCYNY